MNSKKQTIALSLISGGLDGILAAKLIQLQGIKVIGVHFTFPFSFEFHSNEKSEEEAKKAARKLKIELKVIPLGNDFIQVLKKPKHGYGKNVNPCLDCRILCLNKAKKLMHELGADFITTGEVIGQRPMSQRRDTLHLVEKESELRGYLLRPLCAIHLKPTIAEESGLVDRSQLLGITGRGRKEQILLAKQYDLKEFTFGGGGCLLTHAGFARKVFDLLNNDKDFSETDVNLLRIGRHVRLNDNLKLIIARDEKECIALEEFGKKKNYYIFKFVNIPGPLGLTKSKNLTDSEIQLIKDKLISFSHKAKDSTENVEIEIKEN